MNSILKNGNLQVVVNAHGAELTSLKDLSSGVEYIWQANPKYWGKHSPVLFPIIGMLKDDAYTFNGQQYAMEKHGFARDLDFELIDSKSNYCFYQLESTPETFVKYPFHWKLGIAYRLSEKGLEVSYKVENTGDSDMYFSLGAHPAFNCPLFESEIRSDYSLVFEKNEGVKSQLIREGLRSGELVDKFDDSNKIQIGDDIFDDDALIFEGLKSRHVTFVKGEKSYLQVQFEGWPYLGIWSMNRESPYVCVEPWYGVADHVNHGGDISQKEGIQCLKAGSQFSAMLKFLPLL